MRILSVLFIVSACIAMYVFGVVAIDPQTGFEGAFTIVWFLLSAFAFPLFLINSLEKNEKRKQDAVILKERERGARMFLDQLSSTDRFNGITNKDLPIFNNKNEKIGTTTVYSDLSYFLNNKFNPSQS